MLNKMSLDVCNSRKSKLLALFNALEEKDKDIVISMTESLVAQYKKNEKSFLMLQKKELPTM